MKSEERSAKSANEQMCGVIKMQLDSAMPDAGCVGPNTDGLALFDGRVSLNCEIREVQKMGPMFLAHVHIPMTLHSYNETIVACVVGVGENSAEALYGCIQAWFEGVAGPLRALVNDDSAPAPRVTLIENLDQSRELISDVGLSGLRAYIAPPIMRVFAEKEPHLDRIAFLRNFGDSEPWFRFAFEAAAPRRVHIAKATVELKQNHWIRRLEVDGAEDVYMEEWPVQVPSGRTLHSLNFSAIRYALFVFPENSVELSRRAEVDKTILHLSRHCLKFDTIEQLEESMIADGFEPDMVRDVSLCSTLALGRILFHVHGPRWSTKCIRPRRDGRLDQDVPLMSIPAFARSLALADSIKSELPAEFLVLAQRGDEAQFLLKSMEHKGGTSCLSGLVVAPPVIPERGSPEEACRQALEIRNAQLAALAAKPPESKKPWWRIWS